MSPTLVNFLFEAANFLVLAAVLGWLLFKPIRAALGAERDRRAEEEAASAKAREEADELMQQARQAHRTLEDDLQQRRAEMMAEAKREVAALEEAARTKELAEKRARQLRRSAAERAQADRLAEILGRISAASVRRLLEAVSGPSLDLALVRAVCGELAGLPDEAKTACVVESARPLDDAARRALRDALGSPFEERTVPALGAGVRVTTGVGQLDGSAINVGREAARQVTAVAADRPSDPGEAPSGAPDAG